MIFGEDSDFLSKRITFFYGKHGIYDFPQKDRKARIANMMLILLTKIPKMRKEIYNKRMKAEIIKPFQKVVEKE